MLLTDDELCATVRAGVRWAAERDIPDPVRWADLDYAAEAAANVIRQRIDDRLVPARTHSLALPKGVGGEFRHWTAPDPFDEIVFRALVGRAALAIDSALGDEVTSYRLIDDGPGWSMRNYRYSNQLRAAELTARVANDDFGGLGTLDVRNYYPSINTSQLVEIMTGAGVDVDVAMSIGEYLQAWALWGVRGIPIGPEASGLLGNIYLLPVDRALRVAGIEFSRYADDYRLWLGGPLSWTAVYDVAAEAIGTVGLQLNHKKTRHLRTAHGVLRELTNPDLGVLKNLLESDPKRGLAATLDTFDAEVSKKFPNSTRVRFLLGVLRRVVDPYAIAAARDRVELLQADPKAWGEYLKTMHGDRRLDLDWLLEVATAPVQVETAAVAYHLMRVATVRRIGRDHGRTIGEFATDNARDWVPVRCAAAEAWSVSDDWKPATAAEAALAVGDTQQRRALTLTLRRAPKSPAVDKALERVRRSVPECRPSVAWIRSGAAAA